MHFTLDQLGDSAIIVRLDGDDLKIVCREVQAMARTISDSNTDGVIETVPAYSSLAVHYDPTIVGYDHLRTALSEVLSKLKSAGLAPTRLCKIPVCYGGTYGPDLAHVARLHSLAESDVIGLHVGAEYLVAMIGFAPGFPYLLGLPEQIATPRRDQPRHLVAAGSVGIGGNQTGIYSLDSPGGWNIIGRTPIKLFRPKLDQPTLLQAGDIVRFIQIDENRYRELKHQSDSIATHDIT